MKKHKKWLIWLPLLGFLSGCDHFNNSGAQAFQSLSQQQQAHYWQTKKVNALVARLQSMGVIVYRWGDEYELMLPAAILFKGNSTQTTGAQTVLYQAMADLINAQSTPAVQVLAYANNSDSAQRNFALTQNWAETVVDRLRQANVDVGVLSAKGHGACDQVGLNNSATNRIDIRYRVSHDN